MNGETDKPYRKTETLHVRLTPKYLLAFFCLAAILGISHELAHHVTGFLICGDWGYKTFNSFSLAAGCRQSHPNTFWLATLTGPVLFNYIPMWIGFFHMRRADAGSKLFGLTLVFATIPIMRIVFSAMGANDEPWMIRHHFGESQLAFWLMNVAIWLITFPPLIVAWKTIGNRRRLLLFLFYLLALPVFVFFVVGIVLENMIVKHAILADTLWGMPYLVLIAEVLAYAGYQLSKRHLWLPRTSLLDSGARLN